MIRNLLLLLSFIAFQCSPPVKIQAGECTVAVAEQIASDDYFRMSRRKSINDYKLVTEDKGDLFEIQITRKRHNEMVGDQTIMYYGGGAVYKISKNNCRIIEKQFSQ